MLAKRPPTVKPEYFYKSILKTSEPTGRVLDVAESLKDAAFSILPNE